MENSVAILEIETVTDIGERTIKTTLWVSIERAIDHLINLPGYEVCLVKEVRKDHYFFSGYTKKRKYVTITIHEKEVFQ